MGDTGLRRDRRVAPAQKAGAGEITSARAVGEDVHRRAVRLREFIWTVYAPVAATDVVGPSSARRAEGNLSSVMREKLYTTTCASKGVPSWNPALE